MKNLVFFILIFFTFGQSHTQKVIYSVSDLPPARPESTEELWDKVMFERMTSIEEKFGVKFAKNWVPRMQFGCPHYITNNLFFGGCYSQQTHDFWITSAYRTSITDTTLLITSMRELIDHELGHALSDQRGHEIRGILWPDTALYQNSAQNDKLAIDLLAEGVGEYFGNLFSDDVKISDEWLPTSPNSYVWVMRNWHYGAGYWLVKPILDQFGQKGLDYIIFNPLHLPDENIKRACTKYQKTALKSLAEK